jgi:hypothetical protein
VEVQAMLREAKIGDILEKLMDFIYDEYSRSETFRSRGERAKTILDDFESRYLDILGDPGYMGVPLEYMRLLMKRALIEVVSIDGSNITGARLTRNSRIKPTYELIEYVEGKRRPGKSFVKVAGAVAEILGRGVKGYTGR